MIRKIIKIDEEKCNGCGACVSACHESAIQLVDGKAKLIRDDYCDGLGDCLPVCITGAITFEERQAEAYNETAVKANMQKKQEELLCGCLGTNVKEIYHEKTSDKIDTANPNSLNRTIVQTSELMQWPVQIKLVPANALYFENAKLLIAADCTAFAYGNFHRDYIKKHITLIGCPKLDMTDYSEKLTKILKKNNIKSVTVVRMEVPCCKGIEHAVKTALKNSEKMIPWEVVVISTDGKVIG